MNELINIDIAQIYPHPDNPRKELGDLTELMESIKKNGIMQNLTVVPGHKMAGYEWNDLGEKLYSMEESEEGYDELRKQYDSHYSKDGYTLIIGHRRCEAARSAGINEVPCRIIELDYRDQIAMMLEENMQRNDLTIAEQAESFQMMLDLGEDIDSLAEKTGFSKQTIKHRIELAKLDKKLLKEKTENESFQMSLKDMMVLERIEDATERNRILKEATSSSQLSWKVDSFIREIEKEKKKKELIRLFEENGINEVPKSYERESYTKWETIKWIQIDEKTPKLPRKKEVRWYFSFNQFTLVVPKKDDPREKEAAAFRKKNLALNQSLRNLEKDLDAYIREFVLQIIEGKQAIRKSLQEQVKKELWNIMIRSSYCTVSVNNMICYYCGKSIYEIGDDKETISKKMEQVPMLTQMIVCEAKALRDNDSLVNCRNEYEKENSEKYRQFTDILEGYGFTLKQEHIQFLDGTHSLFNKEEEE